MKHARQKYLKSRPAPKSCEHCGKVSDELFAAIDDTCAAQCYHEPYLCRACFVRKYPREEYKFERAKNREEARRNIIDILMALPLGERRAVLIEVYGKLEESGAVQPALATGE